jgi:NAD(P)-dependent dehydrogenase (short-subunit alcohol dehydrogenase family)
LGPAPAEIASVVVFLASEQASYLTAVTVTMDGGQNPVVL